MWKIVSVCLLTGCADWDQHPDGPTEQAVEQILEQGIEQGARWMGHSIDVKIDFTPETDQDKPQAPE